MLRISRQTTARSVTLRMEGEITGPWVDETDRVCASAIAAGGRLRIDLAQVTFVDRAGIELLSKLRRDNAVLKNCSPLLKAQLRSVRRLAA